jgi:hypothetical protein
MGPSSVNVSPSSSYAFLPAWRQPSPDLEALDPFRENSAGRSGDRDLI